MFNRKATSCRLTGATSLAKALSACNEVASIATGDFALAWRRGRCCEDRARDYGPHQVRFLVNTRCGVCVGRFDITVTTSALLNAGILIPSEQASETAPCRVEPEQTCRPMHRCGDDTDLTYAQDTCSASDSVLSDACSHALGRLRLERSPFAEDLSSLTEHVSVQNVQCCESARTTRPMIVRLKIRALTHQATRW